MGFGVRSVRAAINTAGNQTFSVAGIGTPKGCIIEANRAIADDTKANHACWSFGFCDGVRSRVMATYSQRAVGTSNCGKICRDDRLIYLCNPVDGTLEVEGSFVEWATDGVTIDWGSSSAVTYFVTVTFFYGTDCTFYCNHLTASASVDTNTVVTDPGFQLENAILIGSRLTLINTLSANSNAYLKLGLLDYDGVTILQRSLNQMTITAVGTSASENIVSDTHVMRDNSATVHLECTAVSSTGFTVTTRGTGEASVYLYACWKSAGTCAHKINHISSPTATGTWTMSDVGFKPQAMIWLLGSVTTVGGTNTNKTTSGAGAGAFVTYMVNASEHYSTLTRDIDAADTTDTSSWSISALRNYADSGTALHAGTFTAFNSTGGEWNLTAANATARYFTYLAIGEFVAPAGGQPAARRHGLNFSGRNVELGREGVMVV